MVTKKKIAKKHQRSIEQLNHFRCGTCNKWWSVGDAPLSKKVWYCPWCGLEAHT